MHDYWDTNQLRTVYYLNVYHWNPGQVLWTRIVYHMHIIMYAAIQLIAHGQLRTNQNEALL